MYASAFYPVTLPYYFLTSNSIGTLSKHSGEDTYGRGVVLGNDEMGFSYSIKSLKTDKTPVKFVEIPESKVKRSAARDTLVKTGGIEPISLDSLNAFLISEPFNIGEGTTISFSEEGGFNKSDGLIEPGKPGLSDYKINCTVELLEEGSNNSLGVIKQVLFKSGDEQLSGLRASNVKITSKEKRKARLKVTYTANIPNLRGMLVNEYNTVNEEMLSKIASDEFILDETVITYAMEQNYPNPFNPSTTINYQIPKEGIVTLKIYDALGSEIATLVDEVKQVGKYTINFNATGLASGVYFYRLKVNDFSSTKKLILIK